MWPHGDNSYQCHNIKLHVQNHGRGVVHLLEITNIQLEISLLDISEPA